MTLICFCTHPIAFAVNAAALIGVAQFTARLAGRFGMVPVVKVAVTGYVAMMVLLACNLLGLDQLWLMIALLLVGNGFLDLVIPTTAVLALDDHGDIAGAASALMGTLQFVAGAAMMALVGPFTDGTARPMVAGIAGCAVVIFVIARATLSTRKS